MLSFATPLWLLGLLLVPVMWWLHRSGPHLRGVPVSSLLLWRRAVTSTLAAGDQRRPDPAWKRRALLAGLLSIALAGPQVRQPVSRITVWVDDSISMLAREVRGTRLSLGLERVRATLAAAPAADVEVRTLDQPWRAFAGLSPEVIATIIGEAGQLEPTPPPKALLRTDRSHWLLTDGADPTVLGWPGGNRADRYFQVAGIHRNVGIDRLAARRNLQDPRRLNLQLQVVNGGDATEERIVEIATDTGEVARSRQRLAPHTAAMVTADIATANRVSAKLTPADAVAEDDVITLDLRPLRARRVATDATCPRALLDAVRSHPALQLTDAVSGVDAALDCGAAATPRSAPTLRIMAGRLPMPVKGPLTWSSTVPASRHVALQGDSLRIAAQLARPQADDVVLLAAGDTTLILARHSATPLLETALDFGAASAGSSPDTPLVVDFLFSRLLGYSLLDQVATMERGPYAAAVVPAQRLDGTARPDTVHAVRVRDLTRQVLAIGLLVLLWEIVALARNWLQLRTHARAVSA